MNEHQLLWDILPEGLEEYFDLESYEKSELCFRIVLIEKNIVPELPKEYQGKRIVNTVIKPITIDSFPIKGRKGMTQRNKWMKK